jgi:hypothetical protein
MSSTSANETNKVDIDNLESVDAFLRVQSPYFQASIAHADQKATFLLVLVAGLLTYLESDKDFGVKRCFSVIKNAQFQEPLIEVSLMIAVGSLLCVIGLIWAVIWPRFSRKSEALVSWAAIPLKYHKDPTGYASAVMDQDKRTLMESQLKHHHCRAAVCRTKWWWLSMAYGFFVLGFLATFVFLLVKP